MVGKYFNFKIPQNLFQIPFGRKYFFASVTELLSNDSKAERTVMFFNMGGRKTN